MLHFPQALQPISLFFLVSNKFRVTLPYRRLLKKECKKLVSIGMPAKKARSLDEKDASTTRKYEKPILSAEEDEDINNAEHMYELHFQGDMPKSIVG